MSVEIGKKSFAPCKLIAVALALCGFAFNAHAQSITDVLTMTSGSNSIQQGFFGGLGSMSPRVTSDGYVISQFYAHNRVCIGNRCGNQWVTFVLTGVPTDPGQNYISALTSIGTLTGSSASYSYSGGTAVWTWNGADILFPSNTPIQVTITHGAPPLGFLNLKYKVLAIDYVPPGSKSSVTYGSSIMRGANSSSTQTWMNSTNITFTADIGVDIFGIAKGALTATASTTFNQGGTTTASDSISNTTANTNSVFGPPSNSLGVDHDYDVFWVWLNPVFVAYAGINTITPHGYAYDDTDPANTTDVVPVFAYELKNPATMRPNVAAVFARSWDTSGLGGLTAADYNAILSLDPFQANPSYDPNSDAGHRFDQLSGTIVYAPPGTLGGTGATYGGTLTTTTTSSQGQGANTSYSVGLTIGFGSGFDFLAKADADFKIANTFTTTDSWSSTINSTTGQTASYSITPPGTTDNYTGPVTFQIWRDNIYGSFMFFGVP
jgi:hypothetical protein